MLIGMVQIMVKEPTDNIMETAMRNYLLRNVDRFFYSLGYWSRIIGWIVIAMGICLLVSLL